MPSRPRTGLAALAVLATTAGLLATTPAHAAGPDQQSGSAPVFVPAATHADLVKKAQAEQASLVKALGLGSDDALVVKDVLVDADGATHVRAGRTFKGLPVVGGDLVIHRDASGAVTGHSAMFDQPVTIDTSAALPAATAKTKGVAAAKAHRHRDQATLKDAQATGAGLVVLVTDNQTAPKLAYQVTTKGMRADQTPSHMFVYLDADTGATLRTDEQVQNGTGNGEFVGTVNLPTTSTGSGYELRNPNNGNYTTDLNQSQFDPNTPGPTGTIFTDSDDYWGNGQPTNRQTAAVDAQFGADKTFDYYKTFLGRNGIWNNGQGARSRVHYGVNYSNAWWDGTQMTYGDGANNTHPLTELDVAAHEMTHGVTENTAGLDYSGDAGGLNEATSDIFGTAVEWYANLSTDTPDYLMGELININGDGTPLRYMDNPSKDGYSPNCWSTSLASLDPHEASGPLNHWYYLASEGSGAKTINGVSYNSPTCNGQAVTGAGHTNVEKVWYRALSTKLTSTSNYKAAREAAIQSAIELYGADSQTCRAVEGAFNGIAVPAGSAKCTTGGTTPSPSPTPTPTPTPTPVPGGNAVVNGGFEQGQTGWTGTSGPITNDPVRPAHSGSWKMYLGGNGATASEYEQQTVTVPSSGKLSYYLAIDTAEVTRYTRYDTATVSVNGTAVATYSNLDASSGYLQRTVDLSKWAGQRVTLKFAASEDSSSQTSFVFDDVTLG